MNPLVEEIKRQRKYAADDLVDATPQTLKSRQGRKRSAVLKLEDLFFQYRNEVRSQVFVIAVTGEKQDEFADIASQATGIQVVDSDALYSQIASKLDVSVLSRGESNVYVLEAGSRLLEDAAQELGLSSIPQIVFKQQYEGRSRSKDDALALIKRAIVEQAGDELAALFLIDHAVRLAFEHDPEAKSHPILVKAKDEKSLQSLLAGLRVLKNDSVVVLAGPGEAASELSLKEVTEKTVLDTLKKVKKNMKKVPNRHKT